MKNLSQLYYWYLGDHLPFQTHTSFFYRNAIDNFCTNTKFSHWPNANRRFIWINQDYEYRWVPLKPDFLGAWKSVWLKHYLAYPIIIINLIIQRNLATKSWAKWESSLTAVWLKRDPPVYKQIFLKLFDMYEWQIWSIEIWDVSVSDQ